MNNFDCPPQLGLNNFLPLSTEGNSSSSFTLDQSSFNINPYLNLYNSGASLNYPLKSNFESMVNSSGNLGLSKAGKKRFNRLLREGVPFDEAKILAQNPACFAPSTSKSKQETKIFQNPKHVLNGGGRLDDFQDYVQFRMENAGLIPRNTQNPSGMSLTSLFSTPYYKPKKKKKKKSKTVSNAKKLHNQNQKPEDKNSEVKIKTPEERRQARTARRKRLRIKKLKKSQINNSKGEKAPDVKSSTTPLENNKKISQKNAETEVKTFQVPEEVKKKIDTEISLGVIPVDYPQTSFSEEQLKAIQKDILAKVALQKTETVKPRFKGVKIENGLIIIQCADEQSALWLRSIECSLGLQTQIKLKIVDKIPKILTAIGYFPGSEEDSTEFILELISGQNDDLNVNEWKVVDRKEEGGNSVLTILFDETSAEKIKSKESINYKFGFAKFVLDSSAVTSFEQSISK